MLGGYDPERAALVLADAMALGDKAAAKKWSLSERTLCRYRKRLEDDAALAELVRARKSSVEHDLATMRVSFLREALTEMRLKLREATLYEVAGAVKIVGELHQVAMAVEDERPDSPDPEAAEAADGSAGASSATH